MSSWNYTFDPNIPAANNNPSDDQPDMLVNNASINDALAQDHVAFNANFTGIHQFVRFLNDQTPATAYQIPYLNSITNGAYSELRFNEKDAGSSTNQYVSNSNGSTLVLGGIIIKWGLVTVNLSGATATVTYPVAFPRNTFNVQISPQTGNAYNAQPLIDAISATTFTIRRNGTANASCAYYYLAIGN